MEDFGSELVTGPAEWTGISRADGDLQNVNL